jgi:tRNA modification GTPase
VAIATPPVAGALGIVRLSGPDALAVAGALLRAPTSLQRHPSHTVRRVALFAGSEGSRLDDALCVVMRAPRSYTGEDVVEFSCHGSVPILRAVVEHLIRAGARLAEPGEFTRRAFVNGRMDLARAEAVALLIGARTERAAQLAARALAGGLSTKVQVLREKLIDIIAGLEVSLDFPDDDVGVDIKTARDHTAALAREAGDVADSARRGRLVHEGLTVALVGRPNAGKSSLLNALLGNDRAIVAATPGTTRDVIEGSLVIDGVAVRVLDTAGLAAPGDPIEAEGMNRARRAITESDFVILVIDGSLPGRDDGDLTLELAGKRALVVSSKSDIAAAPVADDAIPVSIITGEGMETLVARLRHEIDRAVGDEREGEMLAASLRQVTVLDSITEALRAAEAALVAMPLELALVDLREALRQASTLLGLDVGEAVLDRIFATFCVGK